MKHSYARVIGVDVASETLEVNDSAGQFSRELPNTVAAISKQLVRKIQDRANTLIVCEATGGYEHVLVDVAQEAGSPSASLTRGRCAISPKAMATWRRPTRSMRS